ncbi:MAG: PilZ domain-containing protein [Thermodesulfobacteriota bacterium]
MEERRISKRVPFRSNVRFGPAEPPQFTALITDISDTGTYIKSNRIFPAGTKLFLVIETPEGPFKAQGIVAWAKKAPPHLMRHMQSGMGISFTEVDRGLIDLYREKL